MQHATVVQDDKGLIEPVVETLGLSQELLPPPADGLHDLLAQRLNGYRIHQRCRTRPGQDDPMRPHHPLDDHRIAVIRLHEGSASVVEIPQLLAALLEGLATLPQVTSSPRRITMSRSSGVTGCTERRLPR